MPLAPPPPHALPPPGPHLAPRRMPLPSTRQDARAFNQPLSWDTSKVTNIGGMFYVRPARALAPNSLESGLPPARVHAACAPPPHALRPLGPHLAPHRMPLPLTRQDARAFNQPLSWDTSKVTNIGGMFTVRSARALTANSLESGLPRACRLRRRRLTPSRLPARTSPRFSCAPPFDSAVRKLLVRREQAAHPLRVGGHLGLRLRWLWLGLGFRELPGHLQHQVQHQGLPADGIAGVRS